MVPAVGATVLESRVLRDFKVDNLTTGVAPLLLSLWSSVLTAILFFKAYVRLQMCSLFVKSWFKIFLRLEGDSSVTITLTPFAYLLTDENEFNVLF